MDHSGQFEAQSPVPIAKQAKLVSTRSGRFREEKNFLSWPRYKLIGLCHVDSYKTWNCVPRWNFMKVILEVPLIFVYLCN